MKLKKFKDLLIIKITNFFKKQKFFENNKKLNIKEINI
jgi:hypothetical protein